MAQVRLIGGPADGMLCELAATDEAWVAVLDGLPVILPPEVFDERRVELLDKVNRDWSFYVAEPVAPGSMPVFSCRPHERL